MAAAAPRVRVAKRTDPGRRALADVREIGERLETIRGAAVAVELALRGQNAEQDREIAHCLRAGIVDALGVPLAQLQALRAMLERLRRSGRS